MHQTRLGIVDFDPRCWGVSLSKIALGIGKPQSKQMFICALEYDLKIDFVYNFQNETSL